MEPNGSLTIESGVTLELPLYSRSKSALGANLGEELTNGARTEPGQVVLHPGVMKLHMHDHRRRVRERYRERLLRENLLNADIEGLL